MLASKEVQGRAVSLHEPSDAPPEARPHMSNQQGPTQPNQPQKGARPGAMTMAMQAVQIKPPSGPKVLRIMVAQGTGANERVIEEKVIRQRVTVTVGSSENNHFVIADLPSRMELFQLVGSDYILNFTEDMSGRVGLPGGVQELKDLRSSGAARNAGNYWQVKLAESSKGQVRIGETRILFQFDDAPPVQPKPQLPAAVLGGFSSEVDWAFTAFIMFSFMTLFGSVVVLENWDWPMEPSLAEIPEDLEDLIFAEPPEPVVEEEAEGPAEETEAEAETQTAERSERSETNDNPTPSTSEARAAANTEARAAATDAAAAAEQMLIGALGGSGAFADVLAGGAVTEGAADVFAQAQGAGVATSQSGQMRDRTGGDRAGSATNGLGTLAAAGGPQRARQEGGEVAENAPRGRARAGSVEDDGGTGDFDSQAVVRMIQGRRSAIQRCYETELRNNPQLRGSVRVRMTIQESGSTSGVSAVENSTNSAALGECVSRVVRGFRFNPGPEGGSVTFTFPFVFEPQN